VDLDCLFSLSSPNLRKLNLDNQAPFLAAWFLRGFPKVKIDVKNLINKELGDGLVRLSLRLIQFVTVRKVCKSLIYTLFFVLYFPEMFAFVRQLGFLLATPGNSVSSANAILFQHKSHSNVSP
jgi:hypothetical protein